MLPAFLEGSARPAPPDVPHKQLPRANKVSAWLQLAAHRWRLHAWHRAGEGAWPRRGLGEGQGAAHAQNPTPPHGLGLGCSRTTPPPLPRPRPLQSGGRVKTVLLGVSWPGGGGTLFFQLGQLLAEAPPCPYLSLLQRRRHASFQRCVVISWRPGVQGAIWEVRA